MRDLLPDYVMSSLHDRFVAGVADAEAHFSMHESEEDSVSGALGQSIAMQGPVVFSGAKGTYSVNIKYKKIRGRGPGAPEKLYGLDGLFQISVVDHDGTILRQKAVPFQAKMNWKGKNANLYVQAEKMQKTFGSGVVINFTPRGYQAYPANLVVETNGSLPQLNKLTGMSNLGQILGVDFLECRIGAIGLFFNPVEETFYRQDTLTPSHLITTEVVRLNSNED